MTKKVKITEALRKEIRGRIAELTPHHQWYTIPRDERESVECAYIRIDKVHDVAEVFSDDAVTQMIYQRSTILEAKAKLNLTWLEKNKLWIGAKLYAAEGEAKPEEEKE